MTRYSLLWLLVAGTAAAQIGPGQLPPFPEDLRRYLDLSNSQVDAVNTNNLAFARFSMDKQNRVAQVQRELAEETARDPLDPMALGLRYVELEAIRRELRDQQARTRAQNAGVLNEAQRAKVRALDDVRKLQNTIGQAQCENLLEAQGDPGFGAGNFVPGTAPIQGSLAGVIPYGCGVPGGPYPPAPPYSFPEELRRCLEVSNGQIDTIVGLNVAYNQKVAERNQRMGQVQFEIQQELARNTLDPMAIGIRYAEIEAIRRDLRDSAARVRGSAVAALNDAQRKKLAALDEARKSQQLIGEAQFENLLAPPPEGQPYPGIIVPVPPVVTPAP